MRAIKKKYLFIVVIFVGAALGWIFYNNTNSQLERKNAEKRFGTVSVTPVPTAVNLKNPKSFVGVIVEKTEKGFIVKSKDGSKVSVTLTDSTQYISGKKSDLVVGKELTGVGESDNKGIIAAYTIQIGPKPFK